MRGVRPRPPLHTRRRQRRQASGLHAHRRLHRHVHRLVRERRVLCVRRRDPDLPSVAGDDAWCDDGRPCDGAGSAGGAGPGRRWSTSATTTSARSCRATRGRTRWRWATATANTIARGRTPAPPACPSTPSSRASSRAYRARHGRERPGARGVRVVCGTCPERECNSQTDNTATHVGHDKFPCSKGSLRRPVSGDRRNKPRRGCSCTLAIWTVGWI